MAVLSDFKNDLSTAWVAAAAPADGSSKAYARIDTLDEERGNGQHRQFMFGPGQQQTEMDQGGSILQMFNVYALVFFDRLDRTAKTFEDDIDAERRVLVNAFQSTTSWTAGVIEPCLDNVLEEDPFPRGSLTDAGNIRQGKMRRLRFNFNVLIQET